MVSAAPRHWQCSLRFTCRQKGGGGRRGRSDGITSATDMTISNLHDSGGQERLARSSPQGRRVGHNTATEQVYLQSPVPGTGLVSILLAVPLSFLTSYGRDKMYRTEAVPSLPADDLSRPRPILQSRHTCLNC